ncbi:hypothetical protein DW666_00690 [Streptococcus parasanguinis]|nr:hypothetical protein DW666_00690 [Streptococcus parasanguinis]
MCKRFLMPANAYRKSHINYTKKRGAIGLDFAPTIVRLRIPLISGNLLQTKKIEAHGFYFL